MPHPPAGAAPPDPRKATLFKGIVRGLLPLYLLTVLGERARHGSEIMDTFSEMSGGGWKPSPGSVYPLLKKLEREGLIAGEWRSGRAAAKRIYTLTDAGRAALPALQRQLLDELRAVKEVVDLHIVAFEELLEGEDA